MFTTVPLALQFLITSEFTTVHCHKIIVHSNKGLLQYPPSHSTHSHSPPLNSGVQSEAASVKIHLYVTAITIVLNLESQFNCTHKL